MIGYILAPFHQRSAFPTTIIDTDFRDTEETGATIYQYSVNDPTISDDDSCLTVVCSPGVTIKDLNMRITIVETSVGDVETNDN